MNKIKRARDTQQKHHQVETKIILCHKVQLGKIQTKIRTVSVAKRFWLSSAGVSLLQLNMRGFPQ